MTQTPYHHGDLRQALVTEASRLLAEGGIDALSLRRLAENVGVSRSAPYHHFKDKHELLCAIAEQGFTELDQLIVSARSDSSLPLHQRLSDFVHHYVHFAMHNPERYELMFGRPIWKKSAPTDSLKQVAYNTFRHYVETMSDWLAQSALSSGTDRRLRIAQTSWATLHGLCRLMIDGIYLNPDDIHAVCDEAVTLMSTALHP